MSRRPASPASHPSFPPSPAGGLPPASPTTAPSSSSCLLLFPPPVSSTAVSSICEFDSLLMPSSSAPSPRPAQLAALWPREVLPTPGAAGAANSTTCGEHARRHPGEASFSAKSAFLPPRHERRRHVRKALSMLLERGVVAALEELARKEAEGEAFGLWNRAVGSAAGAILAVLRAMSNRSYSLHPHLTMSGEDMVHQFSETRDWLSSPVRVLCWHPHTTKFAVALRDDTVQVHGLNLPASPTLKYKQQRGIACLAWRPFNASELAVGCVTGLLIWTVDPASVAARPSASSVVHLTSSGHAPVTGLQWDPKGKLLLSSSAADTSMILWNTASETKIPLRRFGGGGVHLISWSSSSSYTALSRGAFILAATPSSLFRIWDAKTWTPEQWNVLPSQGHVQTACWSPSGSHLLFATKGEPTLFALDLSPSAADSGSAPSAAIPVADLSAVAYDAGDGEEVILGGLIECLKWDPLGERLAVLFQDSDAVAVFCTNLYPGLSVSPIGLIMGERGEYPSCMEFSRAFDEGALLTIGWSSGRLQHIPMLFVPNMNSKANVLGGPVVLNPDLEQSFQRDTGDNDDFGPNQPSTQLFSPRPKDG